ncbi:putative lambda repressor [Thiomonas arsenitoxydans]|uniref:Lambda repressor n=1 Tax=Thiomonas arsenitoxydans (strain DSM 22701 / CIP 110005 / 3As) TaxID=426114 RepID=A0ABM9T694_THIA3|nr:putative lambda repressor [Thiomonas arsenitoxydans]CQR32812.1 putative lambda repressor [Thiomonas arsenitoxydans]CQR34186.1 putative lambda repressor [Thiomonas arsenitoxydans]CQR40470.1 putative lambda repressor [Thiomonas arsenitoxydans]
MPLIMTTQLIRSDSALSDAFEKNSRVLDPSVALIAVDGDLHWLNRLGSPPPANTEPCQIYHFEALQPPEASRKSFSAFDQLLDELDQNADSAAQLQEGRKWVAENFYQDRPTLASLRLAAGLSQRQLGEKCGWEQPHVSRYESGKHEPTLTVAMTLAAALGVGLDRFAEAWSNTRQSLQDGAEK